MEYRTPSNFYLKNNRLKKWAFDATKKAFKFVNEKGYLERSLAEYVQETINTNNKQAANELVREFGLLMT